MINPKLNCEYPEPGGARLIEEMVALSVKRVAPQEGRIRRGRHTKATGCVRGVFTIRDNLAVYLASQKTRTAKSLALANTRRK